MRLLALTTSFLLAQPAWALDPAALVDTAINSHILPGFTTLTEATGTLKNTATEDCASDSATLRAAYHEGFDAWMAVSHLRFGPTEEDERAFSLAFWPDTKGFTPKSLSKLITSEDPAVLNAEAFAEVSIAAHGFFALEFLLYDDRIQSLGSDAYRCTLIQAVTNDIDRNANAILADWHTGYADLMRTPSKDGRYTTDLAAVAELFKTLDTGLQFNEEARLGRPLGTFDKPRPLRAEARRSERSLQNITVSLASLEQLARILAAQTPTPAKSLKGAFSLALGHATELEDDPSFAGVANIQGRLRVEILQQYIGNIRSFVLLELGPALDVTAGFNALDGD
ncbi:imelysin family protein [uncultured Shimia sp.]|uniref:imelysin family protein n=1 Tax=uncultured Shimia sp. TaxID=573152 RepID=UPI0025F20DEA|nr:imelysin family protein [uncultured Shimia sp.]